MAISAGTRLGPYEILEAIGRGGMGEVYRARDTRLGRHVAIKVSAEKFSDRFEREARTIATLNHPNICILHDVGPNYLVMELIEGPTLADRIKQRAIHSMKRSPSPGRSSIQSKDRYSNTMDGDSAGARR
jgi:serine/threonine protein kinase